MRNRIPYFSVLPALFPCCSCSCSCSCACSFPISVNPSSPRAFLSLFNRLPPFHRYNCQLANNYEMVCTCFCAVSSPVVPCPLSPVPCYRCSLLPPLRPFLQPKGAVLPLRNNHIIVVCHGSPPPFDTNTIKLAPLPLLPSPVPHLSPPLPTTEHHRTSLHYHFFSYYVIYSCTCVRVRVFVYKYVHMYVYHVYTVGVYIVYNHARKSYDLRACACAGGISPASNPPPTPFFLGFVLGSSYLGQLLRAVT